MFKSYNLGQNWQRRSQIITPHPNHDVENNLGPPLPVLLNLGFAVTSRPLRFVEEPQRNITTKFERNRTVNKRDTSRNVNLRQYSSFRDGFTRAQLGSR